MEALLIAARAQLDDERVSLQRQLAELGEGGEEPSFDEGFADSSQVAAEQGEVRASSPTSARCSTTSSGRWASSTTGPTAPARSAAVHRRRPPRGDAGIPVLRPARLSRLGPVAACASDI